MIELNYHLRPEHLTPPGLKPIIGASLIELLYYYFPGDIVFKDETVDFSAMWGWVQILDFSRGLYTISVSLEDGQTDQFEYTESGETITLMRKSDRLTITSSYAPGAMVVNYDEFAQQTRSFYKRVVADLAKGYPELKQNEAFKQLLEELDDYRKLQ